MNLWPRQKAKNPDPFDQIGKDADANSAQSKKVTEDLKKLAAELAGSLDKGIENA